MLDVGWMLDGWMDGWLEKAELKPTQPSLAGAWLSLAILIRGQDTGDMIPFPVLIISYSFSKIGFGLFVNNGKCTVKDIFQLKVRK